MQWDATPNAGFTTGTPWLPVAADAEQVNVAAQRDDPRSMFSFYRQLIALRQGSRALRSGSYRSLPAPREVFAYLREANGERYAVALNFGDAPRLVQVGGSAQVTLSTDPSHDARAVSGAIHLDPGEGAVARLA